MSFDHSALNRLYRFAYTLTGDEPSAYDLLQDTVERCLRRPPGPLACPEAYARQVMRNRFIDQVRRRQRSPECNEHDGNVELLAIDTHCLEQCAISRNQLEVVWARLDAREREILYYWAVEGMTAAQIATTMGSRRGTVLSRIHRLRARLRANIDDENDILEEAG